MKNRIRTFGLGLLAAVSTTTACRADVISDWVDVWLDTIRATGGPPCPIARNQAVVFMSVYEAVNSIAQTNEPYLDDYLPVTFPASTRAAAAAAAHKALVELYPARQAEYDTLYNTHIAALPDDAARANGIAAGEAAANAILGERANDQTGIVDSYVFQGVPGAYQPTPPDFLDHPFNPGWGQTQCWAMTEGSQFRPNGPLGYNKLSKLLKSTGYAKQVNEVQKFGAVNSTARSAEQTRIAWFWANDRDGTYKPPGHLLHITETLAAQYHLSLVENARLVGLAVLAMADAGAVAWDQKYATDIDLWRPVSAVRHADLDGNSKTKRDASWLPLLEFTPTFPAYTSGHGTFGAAHAAVMKGYFGTDKVTFTIGTDEPIVAGVTRTFHKFSDAARENGISRIYLGVHFRFDADIAYATGTRLGNFVYSKFLRPVCLGDLNGDRRANAADVNLFIAYYFSNDPRADRNHDGTVSPQDVDAFMLQYFAGCSK